MFGVEGEVGGEGALGGRRYLGEAEVLEGGKSGGRGTIWPKGEV